MLRCCQARAGVAVPSVVGDVDEHFGSLLGVLAHLVGEDGLVTDEGAVGVTAGGEDGAMSARIKRAYFVEKAPRKEEELLEGNVLAERNEMHLVIAARELSLRRNKGGRVIHVVAARISRSSIDAYVAHDDGCFRRAGQGRHRAAKDRIIHLKRCWRLRPDDQVRRRRQRSVGTYSRHRCMSSNRTTDCVPDSSGIPKRK